MKMMENNIKWSMNRDEQRQVKHEKIADAAEIMNRRQQEAEEMKAQTAEGRGRAGSRHRLTPRIASNSREK